MTTQAFTDGVTLTAASWFNDVDAVAYAGLTSVSGTNTITAVGPASITAYAARQRFIIIPANTNNGATTLNLTCNSVALGSRNVFCNNAACVGGELRSGVPAILVDDGTRYHIIGNGFSPAPIVNTLGSDVALNNASNYFDGPTVAQGSVGTWLATGSVTLTDTAGSAGFNVKLWDGTTIIASTQVNIPSAGANVCIALSGFLAAPAGNLRLSARDTSSTSGKILFNQSGNSKDSIITAVRIF